ncbi:hypothetical protein DHD32_03640 [Arenibacter sp. TNZ]|nr:hypothetical protein [Arenibacter sp. TNZ]
MSGQPHGAVELCWLLLRPVNQILWIRLILAKLLPGLVKVNFDWSLNYFESDRDMPSVLQIDFAL